MALADICVVAAADVEESRSSFSKGSERAEFAVDIGWEASISSRLLLVAAVESPPPDRQRIVIRFKRAAVSLFCY